MVVNYLGNVLQERKLRNVSQLCPNYLVDIAVIVFKIHNQGQSEQADGGTKGSKIYSASAVI